VSTLRQPLALDTIKPDVCGLNPDLEVLMYKILPEFEATSDELEKPYWMRYIAYGAALDYARDYRFENESFAMIEKNFAHQRKLVLTRTHNQVKVQRAYPRF
jgi:hypothetical protein